MKILHLLLVLLLASEYKLCSGDYISSASYCNNQSGSGNYRCCFEKATYNTPGGEGVETHCLPVNEIQYNNIKALADIQEKFYEGKYNDLEDYELDCSSKYFCISTIYLLIVLFFLN